MNHSCILGSPMDGTNCPDSTYLSCSTESYKSDIENEIIYYTRRFCSKQYEDSKTVSESNITRVVCLDSVCNDAQSNLTLLIISNLTNLSEIDPVVNAQETRLFVI